MGGSREIDNMHTEELLDDTEHQGPNHFQMNLQERITNDQRWKESIFSSKDIMDDDFDGTEDDKRDWYIYCRLRDRIRMMMHFDETSKMEIYLAHAETNSPRAVRAVCQHLADVADIHMFVVEGMLLDFNTYRGGWSYIKGIIINRKTSRQLM